MEASYRTKRLDRGIKARSDDIFALASYRETLYLLLPRLIPIILILTIPLLKDIIGMYWEKVFIFTCIIALLALSWDLLFSVGLASLGQALFFGIGAYFAGYLNDSFGWSSVITIPFATIGGAAICVLFLSPVLRLKGVYFSLVTLALPLMLQRVIEATKILGGTEGLSALTPFSNIWVELYLPALAMLVCLFGFRRLLNSDYGLVLRGIKDNDRTVMAGGINIYWYKIQVVFLAGAVGAFAGAFMTHYYQFVGMPAFALDYSILPLTCAILGGPGTFAGATLGAFILVPLSESLRAFGTLRVVFYSIILVVCIISLPEGIFHFIQRRYHQFEKRITVEERK